MYNNKWGQVRGRLTFDTSLLEKPVKSRDEVILHELLHLKSPNHGRMFKTLLNIYMNKINNNTME